MANLYNCTIENYIEKQYVGEQKIQTAYIGSQEKDAESGKADLRLAALAKYVPLPEQVENIAAQLQTVKCAQDFKQVVRQIYGMCATQQEKSNIVTKPFREALMAFVTDWQPTTDDAVYRQCLQVFRE